MSERARRLRVGVLTGGASAERDISLATGAQIAASLPPERYEVVLLDPLALMARNPALTGEQRALARELQQGGGRIEALPTHETLPRGLEEQIASARRSLVPATRGMGDGAQAPDVVIVALHGPWGEDGRIQGMLDILGLPYTGSGVLASSLAMDKVMAKKILALEGLDVPLGVAVGRADDPAARSVPLPAFVKPVQQGSSLGSAIVEDAGALEAAIAEALRYDDRALVEERLAGRELTVAVIGNDELQALPVIEIVTEHAFFDYGAKYDAGESEELCPAPIPEDAARRAQEIAVRAHRALGCRGMSRTDLIWGADGRMAVLEVNTIPGMTANSLLPKAARAAGISFERLLERLIGWALEDADRRAR